MYKLNHDIKYYSAGKRDRGKKKKKKKKKSLGQGGAEGPDAGSFYGGGGRRPPTTRANTGAPEKKKFSTKVEKLASAIIHDYAKLKTRLSRKRPS